MDDPKLWKLFQQYITQKRPRYDVGVIEENLVYEFESISTNIPTIKKSAHANK